MGLELLQDAGPLDAMLVCCSGGGLVAGCALAAEGLAVPTRIFAVEPQDFNDHQRSLDSGQREQIKPGGSSICDALLAPTPGELTFVINQRLLSGGLSVTDDEVRSAMALAFAALRLVVEPGVPLPWQRCWRGGCQRNINVLGWCCLEVMWTLICLQRC